MKYAGIHHVYLQEHLNCSSRVLPSYPSPIHGAGMPHLGHVTLRILLFCFMFYTCKLGDRWSMFLSDHTRSSQNDPFSSSDSSGCITSHIVMNSIVFMFFTLNKHRHIFSPFQIHTFCICIPGLNIVPGLGKIQFDSSYDRNTSHNIQSCLSHHKRRSYTSIVSGNSVRFTGLSMWSILPSHIHSSLQSMLPILVECCSPPSFNWDGCEFVVQVFKCQA